MAVPASRPAGRDTPYGRMAGLDGLRAVAVAAVATFHSHERWMPGGWLGVTLFFVLSGYLITTGLLNEQQRRGRVQLLDFLRRRVWRLTPALMVLLLAVMMWGLFGPGPTWGSDLFRELPWAAGYGLDYALALGAVPTAALIHLWSLGVEMQFYLLWAIVLAWLLRRGITATQLLVLLLALAIVIGDWRVIMSGHHLVTYARPSIGGPHNRVIYSLDGRADALLLGAALAAALHGRKPPTTVAIRAMLSLVGWVAFGVIVWMLATVHENSPFGVWRGGLTLAAAATAALVAHLLFVPHSPLTRLLSWRPLAAIGRASYSIYLWHVPVIVLVNPPASWKLPLWEIRLGQACIYTPLAAASYLIFERSYYRSRVAAMRRRAEARGRPAPAPRAPALPPVVAHRPPISVPATSRPMSYRPPPPDAARVNGSRKEPARVIPPQTNRPNRTPLRPAVLVPHVPRSDEPLVGASQASAEGPP